MGILRLPSKTSFGRREGGVTGSRVVEIHTFKESTWPAVWAIVSAICNAGDTFTYPTDLSPEQGRAMWIRQSPGKTRVARLTDGEIVGTSHMGPNHMGPGKHIATASFMVAESQRGYGIGRALMIDALSWARSENYIGMQFNAVAASNTAAVSLYREMGFDIVGSIPTGFRHPSQGFVDLYVMYKCLTDASDCNGNRDHRSSSEDQEVAVP